MDKKLQDKSLEGSSELSLRVNRKIIEGLFVINIAAALFFLLALATYSPNDPGWSHFGAIGEINNAAGKTGAWVSDILFSTIGYSAYIFPLILLYRAWLFFAHRDAHDDTDWPSFVLLGIGIMLVTISITGLSSINSPPMASALPFGDGGMLGETLAREFYDSFGLAGGRLFLFALLFIGFSICTDISWMAVLDKLGRSAFLVINRLRGAILNGLNKLKTRKEKQAPVVKRSIERKVELEKQLDNQKKRTPPTISLPKLKPESEPSERVKKEKQTTLFDASEPLPAVNLLAQARLDVKSGYSTDTLEKLSRLLEHKLLDFRVEATVTDVLPGPVVTRFEIQPSPGTKVSTISNLAKDIARSLAVVSVRVVEVIAGKSVIGIEIPNESREMVLFSQVIGSVAFDDSKSPLTMALGHDIGGTPIVADLAKMPHLLVAGTTGSGKSVGVNAMILSMLFKATPDEVRLMLVDPKMLELSIYEGIPHLLTPVITDMKDAANGLRWCVGEMERRYKLMSKLGVRNVSGFNKKVRDAEKAGEPILDPLWQPEMEFVAGEDLPPAPPLETLPFIVVVIDEFADMIMVVGKKVEELIARIAQKARAAGIHLILATQRPSVDVITGLIKANVPTRIAFQVSSKIDSRTILDQGGAEQLLGHGDMLFLPPGTSLLTRVHGAFVSDEDVHSVVQDWKKRGQPNYIQGLIEEGGTGDIPGIASEGGDSEDPEADALYDEAVAFVCETRKASISSVQRKLRIGYNRAARMIETMEAAGVVSSMGTNGQREVLAPAPPKH
ncbi:DNA translocase FtsK [BD1-7 clade bacterium]|uniref:DNA translocase FtsK n=1 Tax=BD1-7 clade bacterium TaxID=2029982 RepID=A0A5S9QL75_9GAMM|nr:DNA translocase FtsK [BD1-7 clade bacterium]